MGGSVTRRRSPTSTMRSPTRDRRARANGGERPVFISWGLFCTVGKKGKGSGVFDRFTLYGFA